MLIFLVFVLSDFFFVQQIFHFFKLGISVISGYSSSDFFCLLIFVLSAILYSNSGSNSDPDSSLNSCSNSDLDSSLNSYCDSHPGSGSD